MIETPAKASQLIARARSLADIPNSAFISHGDEVDSIYESYKDVYSTLTDSNDDYFLNEAALTLTAADLVAGTNSEYTKALPADFFKIRYLDYALQGQWEPVKRFPLSMKDYNPSECYYRIKNSVLWIIWGALTAAATASLRLGYYPPPVVVTAPQAPLVYGTTYTAPLFQLVTSPGYAPWNQTIIYAYNGVGIRAESITANTVGAPVALFTEAAAVTNLVYYKGVLYWIRGGLIWYKTTDLTAAFLLPTQGTVPAAVTSFYISGDTIYYSNATQIRSCDLTGNTDALVTAAVATSLVVIGTTIFYRTAAGDVITVAPSTTMYASGIAKISSDGVNLFILDNGGGLRKVTYNVTTAAIVTDTVLASKVNNFGQPQVDFAQGVTIVPIVNYTYALLYGLDGTVDYTFSYPSNLVPEIIAYQAAIDFKGKQKADTAELKERLAALWARFGQTVKRDEYAPERLRNAYDHMSWGLR